MELMGLRSRLSTYNQAPSAYPSALRLSKCKWMFHHFATSILLGMGFVLKLLSEAEIIAKPNLTFLSLPV